MGSAINTRQTMAWQAEQVMALAPDASSSAAGKGLGAAHKWKTLGANETCAWGTIVGSGKNPYQTSIDLGGPAFKCTCPSRKFPCKHGLGLLLVLAQQPTALTEKTPPAWTAEWLAKRAEAEAKKEKAKEPAEPLDPEAQVKAEAAAARRAATREANVSAGLEDLSVFLSDLVRTGFVTLPGKPSQFWETTAARLVDAQAPGLARRIRALDGISTRGDNWPADLPSRTGVAALAPRGMAAHRFVAGTDASRFAERDRLQPKSGIDPRAGRGSRSLDGDGPADRGG
mgnify:CR=1 FL=1